MLIDQTNTRRFAGPEGQVLAIYDSCRAYTLYASVGVDEAGRTIFADQPRTYFADEVSEISRGGHVAGVQRLLDLSDRHAVTLPDGTIKF